MTFWMRVTPAPDNFANPPGYIEFVNIGEQEQSLGRPAPQTAAQAREACAEWRGRNDRWVYEFVGTEKKYQTIFDWDLEWR